MTSFISGIWHEIWQKQHAKVCKGRIHFPLGDFFSHPNFQPLPCEAAASALSEAAAPALRSITVATRSASRCFSICRVVLKGKAPLRQKRLWHSFCMCSSTDLRDAHCHWNQWTFAISHTALCRPLDDIILCRGWQCSGAQNSQSFRKSRLPNPSVAALKVMHLTFVVNWAKWTAWQCTLPSSDQRKGQKNIKSGVWKTPKEKMREDVTI